jgi:hypothetical protein
MSKLTDNQSLINEIELIKSLLTAAQKALEDNNLQEAGDNSVAAQLRLKPVTSRITELFNQKD